MSVTEHLAKEFHDAYERLAPEYGYKTREVSAVPWADVPEQNKALMMATVEHVMAGAVAENERLREVLGRIADERPGDVEHIAHAKRLARHVLDRLEYDDAAVMDFIDAWAHDYANDDWRALSAAEQLPAARKMMDLACPNYRGAVLAPEIAAVAATLVDLMKNNLPPHISEEEQVDAYLALRRIACGGQ
jgi:hypothetical protein